MRRRIMVLLALGALTALAVPAVAGNGGDDLARVRAASAQFHRVEAVIDAGYQLGWRDPDFRLSGCIAHPTDGAMGFHYFNHEMIDDIALDPLRPEGVVYAPGPKGQLQLAAVEWVVPKAAWDARNDEPPTVLGQELHVLNPALGWYILHAWVWRHNPSGMFEDWNPAVSCD